jgi:hypothetical protein
MGNRPPDLTNWLTKIQVAIELGVGTKTVDRLAVNEDLRRELRPRVGMAPVAVFHPGDVQREKERRMGTTNVVPLDLPVGQESNMSSGIVRASRNTGAAKGIRTTSFGAATSDWLRLPTPVEDWVREQSQCSAYGAPLVQVLIDFAFAAYMKARPDEPPSKSETAV